MANMADMMYMNIKNLSNKKIVFSLTFSSRQN
jgi:hypothetical protein